MATQKQKSATSRAKAPSMKVKKGDTVLVLSGKDKGAKGRVIAAYPQTQKVLVEGVGRVKKHTRISTALAGADPGDRKSTRLNSSH